MWHTPKIITGTSYSGDSIFVLILCLFVCLMVFNATFNNISVISWQSVLLVEEIGDPEKATDRSQVTDKAFHIMLYTSPWSRFELTTSVVIGTDCICSCKSNYHMIKDMTAPCIYIKYSFSVLPFYWRSYKKCYFIFILLLDFNINGICIQVYQFSVSEKINNKMQIWFFLNQFYGAFFLKKYLTEYKIDFSP